MNNGYVVYQSIRSPIPNCQTRTARTTEYRPTVRTMTTLAADVFGKGLYNTTLQNQILEV
jgi:hypothetical protein